MKTIIQGKKIAKRYSVEENKNLTGRFIERPRLVFEESVTWNDIKTTEEEVEYNEGRTALASNLFNLDEDETVQVIDKIYRADIPARVLKTDKIIEEIDINLKESEEKLAELLKEYNKQVIQGHPRLMAWCRVTGNNPEDVDVDDLELALGISTTRRTSSHDESRYCVKKKRYRLFDDED